MVKETHNFYINFKIYSTIYQKQIFPFRDQIRFSQWNSLRDILKPVKYVMSSLRAQIYMNFKNVSMMLGASLVYTANFRPTRAI